MEMDSGRFAWEIADRTGHAHALFGGLLEILVTPMGLSRGEAIAMAVLLEFPAGLSQSEWARLQGVSRQHAHALSRKLGRAGLVVGRRRGREVHVRASAVGRRRVVAARPASEAALTRGIAGLSAREVKDLHRQFGKLVRSLEEARS